MFDFLSQKLSSIFGSFTGKSHITEKDIDSSVQQVQEALIEADVPYAIVDSFIQDLKKDVVGQKISSSIKPGDQFIKVVHNKLVQFLGGSQSTPSTTFTFQIPSIVMMMGLQGSGKTTTISKLAHYVQEQARERGKKRSILFASVDYYRPAALDQLETLAHQQGVTFYKSQSNDPIKAAHDILDYYRENQFELLFFDTAGRLHVDSAMLEELRQLQAIIEPKYKILVLDAMTGQESLNVAQAFDQGVGFNSAILSKTDSKARGGAAFAFRYMLKKPIIFVGTGEKADALEPFKPERMASRILGMGDVLSLIEHAEKKINKVDQESVMKAMVQGKMTLADFANQLDMMGKLGSISSLTQYIPGLAGKKISDEALQKGEVEIKRFKAIIQSMTPKERFYPKILNGSRKQRIAQGAGVSVSDVNLLLTRFEESMQFAKLFKRFGRGPNPFK